jgi:hypothetical protein
MASLNVNRYMYTREHVDRLSIVEIALTFKSLAAALVATIILDRGIM